MRIDIGCAVLQRVSKIYEYFLFDIPLTRTREVASIGWSYIIQVRHRERDACCTASQTSKRCFSLRHRPEYRFETRCVFIFLFSERRRHRSNMAYSNTWCVMNLRDGLHICIRTHEHTSLAFVVSFCPTIGRMSHATASRRMMILPTRFIYLFPCVNAHFPRDASRKCRETRVSAKLTAICMWWCVLKRTY